MQTRLTRRSNEDWIAALRGKDEQSLLAVAELQAYLRRALAKALRSRQPRADELDDLTQEALLQMVKYLPTFRGDSAFPTWATAVAIRVALTELRRRGARARREEHFRQIQADAQAQGQPQAAPPVDETVSRDQLLRTLEWAIATSLTERQRTAVLAELRGMPTIAIAEQLGTNQNALYKLVHDARKKLRSALLSVGYTPEAVHQCVSGEVR